MEANGDLKIPLLQALPEDATVRTVMFQIGGIKCASCVNSVESAIKELHGVNSIMVSPIDGRAIIKYSPKFITAKKIKEAIEDSGFGVEELQEQEISVCRVRIKGMACTSCSESVEKALQMIDGVKKATVGLALEEAKVYFDPNLADANKIVEAIEDAGFGAELISSANDANKVHLKVEGVDSVEDVNIVMSSLELAAGVNHVEFNLKEHIATVSYEPDITGPRSLIHCIQTASSGTKMYQASLHTTSGKRERDKVDEIRSYRDQFLFSCLFSVPVFLFAMVLPMLPPYGNWLNYKIHHMLTLGLFLRWILSTPVQFIVGKRYY
ncbi:hypothetical protein PIB30_037216 [Stylosanthes scabra]|uniref:HMA domain-containing protein n=1 Tax=Stylosanthes scabra TaxID=79078 RepID=A0ABU6ZCK5_9FABA|nr:hypothetical protein [Stylosanthes scabra]